MSHQLTDEQFEALKAWWSKYEASPNSTIGGFPFVSPSGGYGEGDGSVSAVKARLYDAIAPLMKPWRVEGPNIVSGGVFVGCSHVNYRQVICDALNEWENKRAR